MNPDQLTLTSGEQLAAQASRYLRTVDAFAALGADPHAAARARAAQTRAHDPTVAATRPSRSVLRWR